MAYRDDKPARTSRRNHAEREERPARRRNDDQPKRSNRAPRRNDDFEERPKRSSRAPRRDFDRNEDKPKRTFRRSDSEDRPERATSRMPRRDFERDDRSDRPSRSTRPRRDNDFEVRPKRESRTYSDRSPRRDRDFDERPPRRTYGEDRPQRETRSPRRDRDFEERPTRAPHRSPSPTSVSADPARKAAKKDGAIRLNRYIALSGVCSRREADELISTGAVTVNGEICTVLGTLVQPSDKVVVGGEKLKAEKKVYLLMNKPKGYITTLDDPQQRHTVMELIADACQERIYPVGRLDRNTTGVLLFTNDGDLAKKLTHPSHGARKIYHVGLDKPFAKADMETLLQGLTLDDGPIEVDDAEYVEDSHRKEVGIQIHSGRNRIVRRIFEHLGYTVCKLDRVLFAELTKKNLARGEWRFLTEAEVKFLKMNK